MPLPTPQSGQTEKDFIAVCMGNPTMLDDFPDVAQRRAVCQKQWEAKKGMGEIDLAVWTTAYVNDLPDGAFLYVESGGTKDSGGKTVPRGLRHFPYKDATGKIDAAHVRNAIGRIPQSDAPGLTSAKKEALQSKARAMLENLKMSILIGLGDVSEMVSAEMSGEDGTPKRRFVKDLLSVGMYTHPVEGWNLDITTDRMDRWVVAFNRMQQDGVDVEVVTDHSRKAEDVVGRLTEMFRKGDTLYGIHEMIGAGSIELADRVKNVSVLIDQDFKSGKGVSYGEAIIHSSLVQAPVVPGQQPFEQIAASRVVDNVEVPVLMFGTKGAFEMNALVDGLKKLLGAGDDLTETTALERVKKRLTTLDAEKATLSKQVTDLQAQVKSKAASGVELPADLIEQMASTAKQQLDLLVEKGKITPAVAEKLAASLIGTSGQRQLSTLSLEASGNEKSVLTGVIEALQDNDVVKLGEQTGRQVIGMSRLAPDEEGEGDKGETTNEMIAMSAGGAPSGDGDGK